MVDENSITNRAVKFVMDYEIKHGREAIDVQHNRRFKGCDIISISQDRKDVKIIEVKGNASQFGIPDLAENEVTRSGQLTAHFLYLVRFNPTTKEVEKLFIIPASEFSKDDFQEFKSFRVKSNFYTRSNQLEKFKVTF